MTPEGRIKKLVNDAIHRIRASHPGMIWRFMPVQRGMGAPALDYILCVNGRFVTIETKRDEKHDMTPQQRIVALETKNARGYVFLVSGIGSCAVMEAALEHLITDPNGYDQWYWTTENEQSTVSRQQA